MCSGRVVKLPSIYMNAGCHNTNKVAERKEERKGGSERNEGLERKEKREKKEEINIFTF